MAVFNVSKELAKKLGESQWWDGCLHEEIVSFQLFCPQMCMPMDIFTDSISRAIDKHIDTFSLGTMCKETKFMFLNKYGGIRIPLKLMLLLDEMLVK